jgi:hypothetical protein
MVVGRDAIGHFAKSISKQANISWRLVKVIIAAIDISDRRRREFIWIDLGQQ